MNGSHLSVFMMSVALTYSAPQKKCVTRRQGSFTDDSGRIVINNNNKNTYNNGNNFNKGPNRSSGKNPLKTNKPRKRCCPYNFDSENCQIVNERKVCGYNMNGGGPDENPAEQTFNVGNGCWFRRGRLECGYQEGPFEGIRRPPVYDRTEANPEQERDNDDKGNIQKTNDDQDDGLGPEKLIYTNPPLRPKTTNTLPSCVLIRKKIVCSTNQL